MNFYPLPLIGVPAFRGCSTLERLILLYLLSNHSVRRNNMVSLKSNNLIDECVCFETYEPMAGDWLLASGNTERSTDTPPIGEVVEPMNLPN